MLDFFKSHRFKIIIAVIALLFGMMLYSASSDGIANIPRNLLAMITTPVQKATAVVSSAVGGFLDNFVHAQQNADENEQLKQQIAELNKKLIDYEEIKDENEQLKAIAGIKEIHSDFSTATAFVVSRDPSDRYGSFIIDKGTLHGISLNDPVMTENGLVGIVTQVSPISARIKTILSPDVEVGSLENSSKELGVIKGDANLAEEGMTRLSILSGDTSIQKGDLIVTAGSSGLYPKGIPVGTVKEVKSESHGITQFAVVQPLENIDRVESVVVITDFLGQGSELLDFLEE